MPLVGRHLHPRAGDHVVQRPSGQPAVVGEGGGVEQHVALGGIGRAAADQAADHLLDRLDVGGGPGLQRGPERAQHRHVGVVGLQVPLGDHRDRLALLGGLGVDLVVDVGDVRRVHDGGFAVEVAQQPEQDVESDHRPGVADVGIVVDGRPTDIHRHAARIARLERPLLAGHGVVEIKTAHRPWVGRSCRGGAPSHIACGPVSNPGRPAARKDG